MTEVLVVVAFHSGHGHTARQAAAVAAGAAGVGGVTAELLDVGDVGEAGWARLDAADAIVFGSPTYMGSRSAVFQAFAEASSTVWAQGRWRDKLAAGFTNSSGVNGDKLGTLTSLAIFAAQHGMTWVSLGLPPGWLFTADGSPTDLNRLGGFLGALAQSPSDVGPDLAPPDADLRTAAHLGERVAVAARRLAAGRALVGA
ncbi:flavodoxin family protein [Actinokineospora sp. UTMC 2448]|uniref:flavodoxin family protein n=1 Tax=Actinokineospora sp. UTMC 2448 TaxID=2268449 RepID=UPI002164DCAE|nr:flavodoxin family protein [Actinokineospora sp. UTMC 2448]UVS77228.1 NAD(P)H dehydrogenase (quinone) [Actinokineospora sp. UTMC 2448]